MLAMLSHRAGNIHIIIYSSFPCLEFSGRSKMFASPWSNKFSQLRSMSARYMQVSHAKFHRLLAKLWPDLCTYKEANWFSRSSSTRSAIFQRYLSKVCMKQKAWMFWI